MSKQRSTEKNDDNHGGGPGSSHQGGSHGHATRSQNKSNSDPSHQSGASTNPDRARVSGGGGERDRHHTHDPQTKS